MARGDRGEGDVLERRERGYWGEGGGVLERRVVEVERGYCEKGGTQSGNLGRGRLGRGYWELKREEGPLGTKGESLESFVSIYQEHDPYLSSDVLIKENKN